LPATLRVGLTEHQRELVASVARNEVRRADLALQHGADLGEHPVAACWPAAR